jgi:hypothetical protein
MPRLPHALLLLVALIALAVTAHTLTHLPWATVVLLMAAGAVAQGFAGWRPAPPAVYSLAQPSRVARLMAWLARAAIGSAVLCLMLAIGWWALGAPGVAPEWAAAVASPRQWLTGFL